MIYRLAALAVLSACATSLPILTEPDLPELKWFPVSADRASALTRQPIACLRPAQTGAIEAQIKLGELAFNSPALLGGQAEKKGLSCGSCHRNGRGNPLFQLDAVSGEPGTADVTSGLFSKVRADNTFNPLPIPDLALPDGQDQIDRRDRPALATFVRGQIEEEFSGDRPPPAVLDALLTYLQHIDAKVSPCTPEALETLNWQDAWQDAQLAMTQLETAAEAAQDPQLKHFYKRTARLSLGRLHDRYSAPEHADIRNELIKISRTIGAGEVWAANTITLEARLEAEARASLYSEQVLARALQFTSRP